MEMLGTWRMKRMMEVTKRSEGRNSFFLQGEWEDEG